MGLVGWEEWAWGKERAGKGGRTGGGWGKTGVGGKLTKERRGEGRGK